MFNENVTHYGLPLNEEFEHISRRPHPILDEFNMGIWDLQRQLDFWKSQAEHWEKMYVEAKNEHFDYTKNQLGLAVGLVLSGAVQPAMDEEHAKTIHAMVDPFLTAEPKEEKKKGKK